MHVYVMTDWKVWAFGLAGGPAGGYLAVGPFTLHLHWK